MKKILFLIVAVFSVYLAKAQISGNVYDEDQNSLPGVTVVLKGTNTGTVTNFDGAFSIQAKDGDVLVFSFMGFQTQELSVKVDKTLNVYLKQDIVNMDEVVVMGYSDKTKTEISSSVAVVDAGDLKDVTSDDLGSMIQGKVSGVQVVNSTGQPGSSSQIRIRGISTIKPGNEEPLYVVDGIIGGTYDPNDIETVTILKDAGATGMYGARANKGVIIITTKKAKSEKPLVTFKSSVGMRTADQGHLTMMNSQDFYNTTQELYRDPETHEIDKIKFYQDFPQSLKERDFSWTGESFTPAMVQNYHMSVSGKQKDFSYYVSGTYYDEDGTFTNTGYKKINLRANTNYKLSKSINLKNNINIRNSNTSTYDYMDMYYTYLNLPWDNAFDSTGHARYVDSRTPDWWSRDNINPLHSIDNSDYNYTDFSLDYDLVLDVNIFKWLTFSSSNRMSYSTGKTHNFVSPKAAGTYHDKGYIFENQTNWKGFVSTNLLKFKFEKGKHNISGLAGFEINNGYFNFMSVEGKGLPEGFDVPSVASSELNIAGSNTKDYFRSFISQVNYNYDRTYFVTASYRIDATSNFPPDSRIAHFPSISASWLMSNMDFMEGLSWWNVMKIRASYGITGDPDIGASRYMGLFSLNTQYNGNPAAVPYQLQNYNLTWEKTNEVNIGFDFGFFNRLSMSVDLYNNVTKNLIVLASQPLSQGFEYRWENSGEVINKGIELGLNASIIQKKSFEWNVGLSFAKNKNTLTGIDKPFYTTVSGISQIYRNDAEIYTFVLPKWLGVDPETGAPLWEKLIKDENGNVIGSEATSHYAEATPQEVGNALPDFVGGINTSVSYKGFELFANFVYQYGNDVYNFTRRFMDHDGHEPYYNYMEPADDWVRWTKPGDIATHPSMLNAELSRENSSRYLEDGSYFRLNSVSLAYTFPQQMVKKLLLKGLTLSVNANNIFTLTKYWGQDPEVNLQQSDWAMPGVSDFKYPNNKQIVFNLEVKF